MGERVEIIYSIRHSCQACIHPPYQPVAPRQTAGNANKKQTIKTNKIFFIICSSPFVLYFNKKTEPSSYRTTRLYVNGNPAVFIRPVAFRPCLATGLAFSIYSPIFNLKYSTINNNKILIILTFCNNFLRKAGGN